MTVGDLMTRDVWSVRPEASLKETAEGLAERRISGVPVVDEDRRVVGVISEADIVARARGVEGGRLNLFVHLVEGDYDTHRRRLSAETAGGAMTHPVITVREDSPVQRAAALMIDRGVKRLPVVDDDGRLVGIVTRGDLVRAFARGDADIAREIEEQVLLSPFGLSPRAVRVEVDGGVVTLAGQLDSEETAALLVRYVERVLGVVRVDSRLSVRPRAGASTT